MYPVLSPPLSQLPKTSGHRAVGQLVTARIESPELRYRIVDHFNSALLCSSVRFRREEIAAFPEIQKDPATFALILKHLKFTEKAEYSDSDKLLVYNEYGKLRGLKLALLVTKYQFMYGPYVGLMDQAGRITLLRTLPFRGCPKL